MMAQAAEKDFFIVTGIGCFITLYERRKDGYADYPASDSGGFSGYGDRLSGDES